MNKDSIRLTAQILGSLTDPSLDPIALGLSPDQVTLIGSNSQELENRLQRGEIQIQVRIVPSSPELEFKQLVQRYIRAGANTTLMESVLGLTRRETEIERQALGLSSRVGRRIMPDDQERDDLVQLWRNFSAIPRASRYLAVWDHYPTYTLASIHACLLQAGAVRAS